MKMFLPTLAAGVLVAMSGAAFADTSVSAVTDLNVRAGPGPQYPVIGVLAAGQQATLNGCLENSKWCTIAEAEGQGWVYSDYVTADFGGSQVMLTERPADSGVAIVSPPADIGGDDTGAFAGGATGAIAGAIVGGPVGAAVGGAAGTIAGGATGAVIDPPDVVRHYVVTHQEAPIYLDGEVVTGATLPDTVVLREVPDYQYRYVNVNGLPVLVEPQSRQIVYVVR
ncbi:DUF1236 domain-containing protein [Mesorhizobium sp. A623]